MTAFLIAFVAFVLMEPVTALVHRFVMHGFGMGWHRSHHEPPRGAVEANDYDVFTRRARVPGWRKAAVVARAVATG